MLIKSFIKKLDKKLTNNFFKSWVNNIKNRKNNKKKLESLNFQLSVSEKKILLLSDLEKRAIADGCIVECGVGVGYSLTILSNISKKKIYAFDSFAGFPSEFSVNDDPNLKKIFLPSKFHYKLMTLELVKKNLSNNFINIQDFDNRIFFKKGFFPESFKNFNEPISFLHLDVDLYQSYKDCLDFFYPKMIKGGIIAFDEYEPDLKKKKEKGYNFVGAKIAIDEFIAKNYLELKTHYTGYKYCVIF